MTHFTFNALHIKSKSQNATNLICRRLKYVMRKCPKLKPGALTLKCGRGATESFWRAPETPKILNIFNNFSSTLRKKEKIANLFLLRRRKRTTRIPTITIDTYACERSGPNSRNKDKA